MITPSDVVHESRIEVGLSAPAVMQATRPLFWSVRRELWENRSIYIAPLAVGALALFGTLIGLAVNLPGVMRGLPLLDAAHQREQIIQPYDFVAGVLMATQLLVGIFYSLDALHGERRDRSILFWKSLPVSDVTTVLSKASIPILIVPLVTWAVTTAVQWVMLLFSTAVVAGSGLSVATLWARVSFFQMSLMLLYHLLTVHALWHAPIYAWLMLVSGWARRAAFLWALLPPLAIIALERIVFNSSHFAALLLYRFAGGDEGVAMATGNNMPIDPGTQLTVVRFLISPGLWMGLAITAGFFALAVRMRRYREPI